MLKPGGRVFSFSVLAVLVAAAFVFSSSATLAGEEEANPPPPPSREELEQLPRMNSPTDEEAGLPFDIRTEAIKNAALSYGARGGLAWRTFYIRQELENRSTYLDKVFDFQGMLISAPSGLVIEPPVISESVNALLIEGKGTEAAVSDRVYDINADARIVSAPRSWRNYLERDWGEVTPPPDVLRPRDEEEREKWIEWVRKGWDMGIEQADMIFQDDLNQLSADYQGMVRYRMLLSQGMVTPPYALQVDRGVTGGGRTMRVGDRAVQITDLPQLVPGSEAWQPAGR